MNRVLALILLLSLVGCFPDKKFDDTMREIDKNIKEIHDLNQEIKKLVKQREKGGE